MLEHTPTHGHTVNEHEFVFQETFSEKAPDKAKPWTFAAKQVAKQVGDVSLTDFPRQKEYVGSSVFI